MSYPIPQGGIAELTLRAKLNGQRIINTFWFYKDNDVEVLDGAAELEDLSLGMDASFYSPLAPLQSEDVVERTRRAQLIQPIRYQYQERDAGVTEGTAVGASTPSGVSVVLRRKGDLALRQNQGRVFIAGIPQVQVIASQLTAGIYPSWVTLASAGLRATITTAGGSIWRPILYDRGSGTVGCFLTTASADIVIRYQRRREIGKGE